MIPSTCPQPLHIWQTFDLRARALDNRYGKRLSQFLGERELRAVSRPQEIQSSVKHVSNQSLKLPHYQGWFFDVTESLQLIFSYTGIESVVSDRGHSVEERCSSDLWGMLPWNPSPRIQVSFARKDRILHNSCCNATSKPGGTASSKAVIKYLEPHWGRLSPDYVEA